MIRVYTVVGLVLLVFFGATGVPVEASEPTPLLSSSEWENWYVSAYASQWVGGVGSTSMSGLFNVDNLRSSYLYNASVGREWGRPIPSVDSLYLDFEGQLGFHTGQQDHTEVAAAAILRWEHFPWDEELDTSFAVGEGLSWASSVPQREKRSDRGSAQLLNYVLFDVSVSPWKRKRWEGFFRVHHRSGVFGTFSDVYGASNLVGFGIRYRN